MNYQPSAIVIALLLVVGIAILTYAMYSRGRSENKSVYSTPTRVVLVLLRIAIGWHFLVEGLEKLHTPNWSSEGYLREAVGPLAPKFRELAGDPLVAQLTIDVDGKSLPPALDEEWQKYFDAFVAHYGVRDVQRAKAQILFDKARADTVAWLTKRQTVKKISDVPPDDFAEWTMAERLKEHEKLAEKVAKIEAEMPNKGRASWKDWKEAKANLAKFRADMKTGLDAQTAALKKALSLTLTAQQKTMAPVSEPLPRRMEWDRQLDVSDLFVKYGLVVVGVCLIAGCFTRLAAVGGAVLLLMFYLAMPPLPYLPDAPKTEGHYLYVNKNIIEMLALLALACLPTGRWAGLDGLLQFANPFLWNRKTKKPAVVGQAFQPAEPATTQRSSQ